jgi:hypothetical protein
MKQSDDVRPLCPRHYVVMVYTSADSQEADDSKAVEAQHWACPIDECRQNYSAGLGYFTISKNPDYWPVTRSSSLRISMNATQALCGEEHKSAMFIEKFDAGENLQTFRYPEKDCQQTLKIRADGPPAYRLGEGFFRFA